MSRYVFDVRARINGVDREYRETDPNELLKQIYAFHKNGIEYCVIRKEVD